MGGGGSSAPEADRRRHQMARFGAALFGAAAVITLSGLLLPHQPQVDETGQAVAAAISMAASVALVLSGDRTPRWAFNAAMALGTVLISLSLLFNGERSGGAAGGDEMFYLWIGLFAGYYLGRTETVLHVAFVAVAYAATLYAIDPGQVATSRWLGTVGLLAVSATVVRLLSERIERLMARLDVAAHTDSLTGLANRHAFEDCFTRESSRATRHGGGFALLLADLDRLKEINDQHGHEAGDDALRKVGEVLREHLRKEDFAARIGGDEFALLLPETDRDGAEQLGERLSHSLCERIPAARSFGMSVGVALPGIDGTTLDELMRAADEALYESKKANGSAAGRVHPALRRAAGTIA